MFPSLIGTHNLFLTDKFATKFENLTLEGFMFKLVSFNIL